MKTALISSAVAIALCSSINVEAGTTGLTGVWTGEYIWADLGPGGGCDICPGIAQPWTFNFDNGTAELVNTIDFFGHTYTFHDTTFTDNNDGTYSGLILFDVISDSGEWYDIQVDILWDITDSGIVSTLYGKIPPDSLFFPGSNMTFNGDLNPVPIPAAIWLFGSGLIGLVGVARRKKSYLYM